MGSGNDRHADLPQSLSRGFAAGGPDIRLRGEHVYSLVHSLRKAVGYLFPGINGVCAQYDVNVAARVYGRPDQSPVTNKSARPGVADLGDALHAELDHVWHEQAALAAAPLPGLAWAGQCGTVTKPAS
jgi:hypothetical protein